MKKRFYGLLVLVAAVLLLAAGSALAQTEACPVNAPPALGEYTTGWQLYSGAPAAYQVTLAVDEATGLRTYTLHDPASWGVAEAAMGTWRYMAEEALLAADAGDTADVTEPRQEPGWYQTAQGGTDILLELTDADYAELGFPAWRAPCAAGADALVLNVYLGQVRELYIYVDYLFGDDSISITAEDNSCLINLMEEQEHGLVTSYASYDGNGVLAYAVYAQEAGDGSFTAWRTEAIPGREEYVLTTITHMDAVGNTCYWENGQWQNADFEKVDAPEGITADSVPYTLTGEWLGIPFASPGDAPEGSFPAGACAGDASLRAAEYLPWPGDGEALYADWAEGQSVPLLPAAAWQTLEDGSLVYTLTGVDAWGVQAAHQCGWRWAEETGDWQPDGQLTPGEMRFYAAPEVTDLYWQQPCEEPGLSVTLSLNRANMRQEMGLDSADEGWWWQLDNQGGMLYARPLDESRTLTAEYEAYRLFQYEVLTVDASGVPVSQQTFDAPETAPDTYTLHLYYHYSENVTEEALWLRDIGWYSYETGKPCEGPAGVEPEKCLPLEVR